MGLGIRRSESYTFSSSSCKKRNNFTSHSLRKRRPHHLQDCCSSSACLAAKAAFVSDSCASWLVRPSTRLGLTIYRARGITSSHPLRRGKFSLSCLIFSLASWTNEHPSTRQSGLRSINKQQPFYCAQIITVRLPPVN